MLAGMCKNPQVDIDGPAVAELMADVAAAVSRRAAAVSEQVYEAVSYTHLTLPTNREV